MGEERRMGTSDTGSISKRVNNLVGLEPRCEAVKKQISRVPSCTRDLLWCNGYPETQQLIQQEAPVTFHGFRGSRIQEGIVWAVVAQGLS